MHRDGLTAAEAAEQIREARAELWQRLEDGDDQEDLYNFCEEEFGLEPDFLEELLF